MNNEEVLCIGLVERIGIEGSILKHEKQVEMINTLLNNQ